jgi:hypothetical protein
MPVIRRQSDRSAQRDRPTLRSIRPTRAVSLALCLVNNAGEPSPAGGAGSSPTTGGRVSRRSGRSVLRILPAGHFLVSVVGRPIMPN